MNFLSREKIYKKKQLDTHVYMCVYPTVCLEHNLLHKFVLESRINITGACRKARQKLEILVFYLLFTCK